MQEDAFRGKYGRYPQTAPWDADLRRKPLTPVAAKMARVAHSMIKTNQPCRSFFEQALPGSPSLCLRLLERVRLRRECSDLPPGSLGCFHNGEDRRVSGFDLVSTVVSQDSLQREKHWMQYRLFKNAKRLFPLVRDAFAC